MYQLFRSLAYIHFMGICHRDIKPQNLLLDPATGILKLCDFGRYVHRARGRCCVGPAGSTTGSGHSLTSRISASFAAVPARGGGGGRATHAARCAHSAKVLVAGEPNVAYICSRYYRAPELIFGASQYTTSIGTPCLTRACARGQVP